MLRYSTAIVGCLHRITATIKVEGSQSQYQDFMGDLRKALSTTQCRALEKVFFSFFYSTIVDESFTISTEKQKLSISGICDALLCE
jgi:hypothetical protein